MEPVESDGFCFYTDSKTHFNKHWEKYLLKTSVLLIRERDLCEKNEHF